MRPNLIRLAGNLFSSTGAHGDSRRQLNLARPFTGHRPMTASMSTSIPIDVLKNTAKAKVEGEKFGEEKSQKDEQNMEAADKLLGSKIAIPSQHRAQEHEKWNKIEVMSPEEAEKLRAKYAQQADDKLVKEQGCGPNSFVSKTLILPYILRTRGADLEGNSITLCNFHDLYLANLLKKKGCKNITLVEKSFDNSQIIKEK
ncbi:unnamed protein product, partial [Mesorhabditis belari]|uniref:Uncharacterized protein n=1 Tax=Mesorhabditis belari TaxID=2138241 RepID=A0AAF3F1K9_9BILA